MTALHRAVERAAAVDPITVEVIGSAFMSIAEEMGETLVRASYSTNIKERRDCSTALFDADGLSLCQAEHIPMHLGSFLTFIQAIKDRIDPATIAPGDVFIGNDPYVGGGTHLPDIVLAEPAFVDGRIVAWAINTAHHSDFADRGHAHIYQEAIRIPPVRLRRGDVVQEDVLDLILLNCQVPRERLSDLRAQLAANRLGVRRIVSLHQRYGSETVLAAGAALQDYADRKMRAGLSAIPDGTYRFEDAFESLEVREPQRISVAITILGDTITLRFEAPPQVRAAANMPYTALLSAVNYAVKAAVDPTIPPNGGLARAITVEAVPGTIVNCVHPAAVNNRMSCCQRVVDIVLGALAQAMPHRMPACSASATIAALFSGTRDDGAPWVYLGVIGGGAGARPTKDGLDGVQVHLTNTSNLPAEALETEYPLTLLRYELAEGSGGHGRFRGGLGLWRRYRVERDCRIELDGSRIVTRPWGLAGGDAGQGLAIRVDGVDTLFPLGVGLLKAGQVIDLVSPGGGGFGPPPARDPDASARDRAEGLFGT